MITPELAREYARVRKANPSIPADFAARWARARLETRAFYAELGETDDNTHTLERDGVSYEIKISDSEVDWQDEFDCYSKDDLEAFDQGLAGFAYVVVTATLPDGTIGEDSLGGIDHGWNWVESSGLSVTEQVLSVVLDHDMLGEARDDAMSNATAAHLAASLDVVSAAKIIGSEFFPRFPRDDAAGSWSLIDADHQRLYIDIARDLARLRGELPDRPDVPRCDHEIPGNERLLCDCPVTP